MTIIQIYREWNKNRTKSLILALALVACAESPPKPHYQPMQVAISNDMFIDKLLTEQRTPYSCQRLYDEQRKCAMNPHCDARTLERLRKQCLLDGGRP